VKPLLVKTLDFPKYPYEKKQISQNSRSTSIILINMKIIEYTELMEYGKQLVAKATNHGNDKLM
jgi:hypothetical protein